MLKQSYSNTKKQGQAGLGIAIAWYTSQEYTISVPLIDSQDYDLIVDKNGVLQRVQVKTATGKRNGNYRVQLSMKGGNRKINFIQKTANKLIYDTLFVVCSDGTLYEIPKEIIESITDNISLYEKYDPYKISFSDVL